MTTRANALGFNNDVLLRGLTYPAPGANLADNSDFSLNQRKTNSFTLVGPGGTTYGSQYTVDRWMLCYSPNAQVTAKVTNLGDNLTSVQFGRTSNSTDTNPVYLLQPFSFAQTNQVAGQTITVSWNAYGGASAVSSNATLACYIYYSTGGTETSNAQRTFTYLAANGPCNYSLVAQSGQNTNANPASPIYTATFNIPISASQISIEFVYRPAAATASSSDYAVMSFCKVELGNAATQWTSPIPALSLLSCRQFYYTTYLAGIYPTTISGTNDGWIFLPNTATVPQYGIIGQILFPVPMRAIPTVTTIAPGTSTATAVALVSAPTASGTTTTPFTALGANTGGVINVSRSGVQIINNSTAAIGPAGGGGFGVHINASADLI